MSTQSFGNRQFETNPNSEITTPCLFLWVIAKAEEKQKAFHTCTEIQLKGETKDEIV